MIQPKLVHLIAAARPNFMKVAPLWHALKATADFRPLIVHTGQHYDAAMSDDIFADLGLPAPDHHLGIGSGTHAEQTGRVMIEYGRVAEARRPDWLVVVGDVNSTVAAALVGAKLGIRTVHLEAGLRSRDRTMPEEINRIATDAISDVLWTPSPDADRNLLAEGVPAERITRVGNIMLDSFERSRPAIAAARAPEALGLAGRAYGVVTLHRPSNVDASAPLRRLVDSLCAVQRRLPIVFPVHPRTADQMSRQGLAFSSPGVRLLEPMGYLEFLSLLEGAAGALTDSGGIQEETTYLGIPCFTLRANTERPITCELGTNVLLGLAPERIAEVPALVTAARGRPASVPPGWDGTAAARVVDVIAAGIPEWDPPGPAARAAAESSVSVA